MFFAPITRAANLRAMRRFFADPGQRGPGQARTPAAQRAQWRAFPRVLAPIIATWLFALALSQPVFGDTVVPTWPPTDTSTVVLQPPSVTVDGWLPVGDSSGSCDAARACALGAWAENFTFTSSGASWTDTPQSTWTLTPTSGLVRQPLMGAVDGWLPVGNSGGPCDAAYSCPLGVGMENLTLTSSGTLYSDSRALTLTSERDRVNVSAEVSATRTAMSLSTDFNVALQYRPTDTIKIGIDGRTGAEAGIPSALGAGAMVAGSTDALSGPLGSADAVVSRISADYDAGSWSMQAKVVTGSSFILEAFRIQDSVSRNWTANIAIEHTVASVTTLDAGELAISGRIGDVSVALTYLQAPSGYIFEPDTVLQGVSQTGRPILSGGVSMWGWQWALNGIGGPVGSLTLTAERSQPRIAVTISPDPFGMWLTHDSRF